jgi:heme/copper-type cytochrome/quinol oxidase subunit 4
LYFFSVSFCFSLQLSGFTVISFHCICIRETTDDSRCVPLVSFLPFVQLTYQFCFLERITRKSQGRMLWRFLETYIASSTWPCFKAIVASFN